MCMAGVEVCELQHGPLRSLPRHLQHPGSACSWNSSGDGSQGLARCRGVSEWSVGRVTVDLCRQASGVPVRSQWRSLRSDHR